MESIGEAKNFYIRNESLVLSEQHLMSSLVMDIMIFFSIGSIERIVLVILDMIKATDTPSAIESFNRLDLIFCQVKVKDINVGLDSFWSDRLGNDNYSSLCLELDEDLCRSLVVLLCNVQNLGFLQ